MSCSHHRTPSTLPSANGRCVLSRVLLLLLLLSPLEPSLLLCELQLPYLLCLLYLHDQPFLLFFFLFDDPLLDVILLPLMEHTRQDLHFTAHVVQFVIKVTVLFLLLC